MAYADWDITGPESAVINSSLSTPLPQPFAGPYCRQVGTTGNQGRMLVSASYEGGAFVGVPITKMIRVQTCIRKVDAGGGYVGGVYVKGTGGGLPGGYGFVVTSFGGATSWAVVGNDHVTFYGVPFAGVSANTEWVSIRMDVFPISTSGDRIVVSRETSIGSGVYTPLSINGGDPASGVFISSSSAQYAPWGGSTRCFVASGNNAYGSNSSMYVDKTYFAVSDAP